MAQDAERVGFLAHRGRPARVLALVGCLMGPSACSAVPDYVNPVSWYEGVTGGFGGGAEEEQLAGPVPGEDQPYPNLASVPERPEEAPSPAEMGALAEGLIADREHAQYTGEVIRRSEEYGESALAAPSPAAPSPRPPPALPTPVTPAATVTAQPVPPLPEPPSAEPSFPSVEPVPAAPVPPATSSPAPPSSPTVAQAAPSTLPQPTTVATPPKVSGDEVLSVATLKELIKAKFEASDLGAGVPAGAGQPAAGAFPQPSGVSGASPAPSVTEPARSLPLVSTGALEGAATGLTASVAGGSVRVAVIQFAHGSAKLSARQRKILKNVVALHRSRGGVIRVVGHASRRTREMPSDQHLLANFAMSLERAQAVARELMRLGVKPEDLVIVAKGDSEPIYYEWMPSGEAHNRRAEIYIDT